MGHYEADYEWEQTGQRQRIEAEIRNRKDNMTAGGGEIPSISNVAYSSNSYSTGALGISGADGPQGQAGIVWDGVAGNPDWVGGPLARRVSNLPQDPQEQFQKALDDLSKRQEPKPIQQEQYTMRIVKVFIADPNENLPLEKRILYTGDEKLTDSNDTELYFELPMAELVKTHNILRAATVDRKATDKAGRDVFLEPIRIRDLKMVVVDVAKF